MLNKVILVFVEGESDDAIISHILDNLVATAQTIGIKVEILFGDPFSEQSNRSSSGLTIMKNELELFLDKSRFKPSDIVYMAYITDLDASYFDIQYYTVDSSASFSNNKSYQYDLAGNRIICKTENAKKSLIRNRQEKAKKIGQLNSDQVQLTVKRIDIPLGLYFNSINLEHVLIGKLLDDDQKTDNVDKIIDEYEDDIESLLMLFQSKSVTESYIDSWKKVREDSRHRLDLPMSNVHLLFKKILQVIEGG